MPLGSEAFSGQKILFFQSLLFFVKFSLNYKFLSAREIAADFR